MTEHKFNLRPWTPEEKAALMDRYETDIDLDALCRDLDRTRQAVQRMACDMGLSRKREITVRPVTEPDLWAAMRNWPAPAPAQLCWRV